MKYWQIGIGDGTIDMVDIFIKLKVALIGPGRDGDYFDNKEKYENTNDFRYVRDFAEEVQIGDIFVLRHIINSHPNTWRIYAVGKVSSSYSYEPILNNVDENQWDVQHCHRVDWIDVRNQNITVNSGGAPGRFQRLKEGNSLQLKAKELLEKKVIVDSRN